MPLSELEQAFEETLDAAEEVKGIREKVTLRAVEIDALIETDITDLLPVGGGEANTSTVKISVRKTDVVPIFTKLEPITVHGQNLAVLFYAILEARIDAVCGDPSIEIEQG